MNVIADLFFLSHVFLIINRQYTTIFLCTILYVLALSLYQQFKFLLQSISDNLYRYLDFGDSNAYHLLCISFIPSDISS